MKHNVEEISKELRANETPYIPMIDYIDRIGKPPSQEVQESLNRTSERLRQIVKDRGLKVLVVDSKDPLRRLKEI